MKKMTIAVIVAGVIGSSASAGDLVDTVTNAVKSTIVPVEVRVGTGYGKTDNVGGASLMLELNPSIKNEFYWNFEGETGKNFYKAEEKVYFSMPIEPDVFMGFGYLNADGLATTGACSVGGECLPEYTTTTAKSFTESGAYGIVGIGKSILFSDIKATGNLGYRFGGVEGVSATMGISKKFGNEFWSKEFGLKVGYEQIKSNVENIDRAAIYGTVVF